MAREGKRVHLLGMAHYALRSFFETRKTQAETHPVGCSVVLTEGVTGLYPGYSFNPTQEEVFSYMLKIQDLYRRVFDESMVTQDAFQVDRTRIASDISFHEYSLDWEQSLPGVRHHSAELDKILQQKGPLDKELVKKFKKLILLELNPDLAKAEDSSSLMRGGKSPLNLKVEQRDKALLDMVRLQSRYYREFILPWGASHLPDLTEKFLADGWEYVQDSKTHTTFMYVEAA